MVSVPQNGSAYAFDSAISRGYLYGSTGKISMYHHKFMANNPQFIASIEQRKIEIETEDKGP